MRRVLGVAGVVLVAALAACGTSAAHPFPSPPSSTLPVGPGPQKVYTVQPQPAANSCHYRHKGSYPLPDPRCTPGAISPAVTQSNIKTTICVRGYTTGIRPPRAITGAEKRANAKSYGYTGSFKAGEYDHLVMLDLGGDPNDPRNLWVEPNDDPKATSTLNSKDKVETAAHTAVCAGTMPLADAQLGMATDWTALGRTLRVLP